MASAVAWVRRRRTCWSNWCGRPGLTRGLFGAKITGGGSGGTVAILGAGAAAHHTVEEIAEEYRRRTGNPARVIAGSGPGALDLPPWHAVTDAHGAIHAH